MFRIEICGGIATGKTTMAEQISAVGKIALAREVFESVPFWKKFYENPRVYEFSKNVSFLLFHADCLRDASASPHGTVCDFAFLQDLSYAAISPRRKEEFPILQAIHRHLARSFSPPSAIIHLSCSTQTQVERIRARGRAPERSIGEQYLDDLNAAIRQDVSTLSEAGDSAPLIIPFETDTITLAEYRDAAAQLYAQVINRIGSPVSSSP